MIKYISRPALLISMSILFYHCGNAQPLNRKEGFNRQDTLRGSIGPGRDWWDVECYSISVTPDYAGRSITGETKIYFTAKNGTGKIMQIDLQQPLVIDSILLLENNIHIKKYWREGNVYFIDFGNSVFEEGPDKRSKTKKSYELSIRYHGNPRVAKNAPWDGGWIFGKDTKGRPWMTVACQGLGASVWYPCKDYQGDEPEYAWLNITVPDSLVAVGNGRLLEKKNNGNGTTSWQWKVNSPINNYDIIPYIGKYVNYTDTLMGEKGKLDLSYWVLDYDLEKAKAQFGRDVKRMLRAFEYWFGPYPFYDDGYKLVESSHLGMEHQSAVAYGNKFKDGYLGSDLSGSGWGMKWDYIIVHESGHEWFGNNITTKDIADMWVHEGFTMYSEALFIEYYYGKKAADEYVAGIRNKIYNDKPLVGPYGVNQEGSGDMYNKGASMLHTVRQVINDDHLFRSILRGLNSEFYHQTTTSKEVEAYISKKTGKDLSKVFDQYLRTTQIPVLDIRGEKDSITYKWTNCVKGFNMPVKLVSGEWIYPTEKDQHFRLSKGSFPPAVNRNFYIKVQMGLPE